jgi:two-component system, sensor histidine kinase and response regulator
MSVGKERRTPDLALRLAEAEATIEALLSGQIDAVVDSGSATPVMLAKAQDALRESEERLRRERDRAQRYLDTADVILLALDLDGRITLVNRFACSILGWSAAELLGCDWVETCLPARARRKLSQTFLNLVSGDLSIVENPILTRSGGERLVEWHNTLLRDDEGQVIGTLSSGTDTTERNRAAESLRAAEERMRFALEAASVGIWDMDCTTEVVRWSEILESQYGLQTGTFGGTFQAFIECIQADDRESVLKTIWKAMKFGTDFSILNRSVRFDGTVRWLSGAGRFLFNEAGQPVRGVGISQDVTSRMEAEAELRAAKHTAEAASQAKSEFLANMSHELRTPMNGVIGMTDIVLDTELTAEQREYLEIVKSSAGGLLTIINDVLDFSKIEARKLAFDLIDFNPHDAIVDTVNTVALTAQQKGLELIVDIGPAVPWKLTGDPGRLRQILVNLLGNAIKFTHRGEVALRVTREEAGPQDGVVLHFSIRDTGVGIPRDRQECIFEAFTQADSSTTRMYGGTGLGLAISSQLIQLMGGRIWVESETGCGSIFHFTARFAEAKVPATLVAVPGEVDVRDTKLKLGDRSGVYVGALVDAD